MSTPSISLEPGDSLGLLETRGLTALLEALDAMVKAAPVTLVGWQKIGSEHVTVVVRGDTAAVQAAVGAGEAVARGLNRLISAHVIPRPDAGLSVLLRGLIPGTPEIASGGSA